MLTTQANAKKGSSPRVIPRLTFGLSWIIVLPVTAWGISSYYLPVLGGSMIQMKTWIVTLAILLIAGTSIIIHILAHWSAARLAGELPPSGFTLLVFGEAAQDWPIAGSRKSEILVAGAGPLANLLLTGLAYLVWNTQTNNTVNLIALFLVGFNAWMFVINLIPVFPLDGGRISRVLFLDLGLPPGPGARRSRLIGGIVAALLAGWGAFLILQHLRFSWVTGLITLLFALVMVDGLWRHLKEETSAALPTAKGGEFHTMRAIPLGLLCLVMTGTASGLLLTNNGLDAPGLALSVAPMVSMPASYQHPFAGQFYLVTVISQAPITAGEWVLGQFDPAIQVVPPETITPTNTSPQRQAQQDFQMLDDSETTAIAVGLKLAGYNTAAVGKGVKVDTILSNSHANGLLQLGDIITGLNGTPVQTTADLINDINQQTSLAAVHLSVTRGTQQINIDVPLMAAPSPGGSPKLGIRIESAGIEYRPPFPISIQTDKISGGPSAGLMFTLTVFNLLTSQDLTGGRKIAGTGTINLDGSVGPIGGVKQKIFAAEGVGATYFLCPVENYADAVSVATSIKVVKIATVEQALAFLQSLPAQ